MNTINIAYLFVSIIIGYSFFHNPVWISTLHLILIFWVCSLSKEESPPPFLPGGGGGERATTHSVSWLVLPLILDQNTILLLFIVTQLLSNCRIWYHIHNRYHTYATVSTLSNKFNCLKQKDREREYTTLHKKTVIIETEHELTLLSYKWYLHSCTFSRMRRISYLFDFFCVSLPFPFTYCS